MEPVLATEIEVSDARSFRNEIRKYRAVRISNLSRLQIEDFPFDIKQCELIVNAIRRSTSLKQLQFSLAQYNLVYLLQGVLPAHPTIRSVTICSYLSSRFVELAPIEKMIQESQWTELRIIIQERSAVHVDLLERICSGVSLNSTILTLDLSKSAMDENVKDLIHLFTLNSTVNSLFMQFFSEVDITGLAQVLAEKKQLIAFGLINALGQQEANWTAMSRALQANSSLTHLELHPIILHTFSYAQGLAGILANAKLKILDLGMSADDMETVYDALLTHTSLTILDVGSQISDGDRLSRAIKELPSLKHLSFCNEDGAEQLANALAENSTLTSLEIASFSNLDGHWDKMKAALMRNNTLRRLAICSPSIDADGWPHLAELLHTSQNLKVFTLNDTFPERAHFRLLCKALRENTSLTDVTLPVHDPWYKSIVELFSALSGNTTLRSLTLVGGQTAQLAGYTPSKVYETLNVECLDLSQCELQEPFVREVARIGRERKIARRGEATNLIVSLFNIARRPETLALFPREIWLQIFGHIHSNYFDVRATAGAVFDDTALRRVVQFDDDPLPAYCHLE